MTNIAAIIIRLILCFLFIQLFKVVFELGALHSKLGLYTMLAAISLQLAGLIVAVALGIIFGKRAALGWQREVDKYGEAKVAARCRLICELTSCISIVSALPSSYILGYALRTSFVVPFIHAVLLYIISLSAVSLFFTRAMHGLRDARKL